MKTCNCNLSYANTGSANCKQLMNVARKLFIVPTYDSTGTYNKIAAGDTLNLSYFTGKINQADATKRWYPTGLIDNVEDVRAEPLMESLNSGKQIFVREGVRTFKGIIVEESNIIIDKYKAFQCKEFSAFIIDKDGNLIGNYDGTDLYPIKIENETFNPTLVKTTDTTVQKIHLSFEFDISELDEDLRMVTAAEAGTNLLNLSGLLDVNCATSAPGQTTVTATLTLDYGSFKTPILVTGLLAADFALYNITDAAAITGFTTTESSTGVYVFTFTSQTVADVIRISLSKNGYEMTATNFTVV